MKDSCAFQKGEKGNPILMIFKEPGAAEVLDGHPVADVTGRNLMHLLFLLQKSRLGKRYSGHLRYHALTILNVLPKPVFTKSERMLGVNDVDWKDITERWQKLAGLVVGDSRKTLVICCGHTAEDFYRKCMQNRPEVDRIVITICHLGMKGMNKTISLGGGNVVAPTYQRLLTIAEYIDFSVRKGGCNAWEDFVSYLKGHPRQRIDASGYKKRMDDYLIMLEGGCE